MAETEPLRTPWPPADRLALSSQCDCDAHESCPYPEACRCFCHSPEGLTARGDEQCLRCGHINDVPWFAPSPIWNKVVRENGHSEMLCPMCFMELAEAAGVKTTAWCVTTENHDPAIDAAKEIVATAIAHDVTTAQSSLARKVLEAVEAEHVAGVSPEEDKVGAASDWGYNHGLDDALAAIKRVCESEGVNSS